MTKVKRTIESAGAGLDYRSDDLGHAAWVEEGQLLAYHVTDDPERVKAAIVQGSLMTTSYRHSELGPGLYGSGIPETWLCRSTAKYKFLQSLTDEQKARLANGLRLEVSKLSYFGYIDRIEKERALNMIDAYADGQAHSESLVTLADQPFNIYFWSRQWQESHGLPVGDSPYRVKLQAHGRFAEVDGYLTNTEVENLLNAGYDGAYLKQGFVSTAQIVFWRACAVKVLDVERVAL